MESRSFARSRMLGIGLALAALVLLVACGSDQKGASVQPAGDMAPADQQVLRLRLTGEPKTIDPQLSNFTSETTLTKPLFAGLFTYDENLRVVPNVATELPTVDNGGLSRDGMTYTIELNKDAKWSDGKQVTASDFAYAMKRALDPKLAGPYASFYYGLAGAKDYNTALGTKDAPKDPNPEALAALRDKVGVSAKDASTVVYQLTQPNPSFLNLLTLWTAFPVRQDVIDRYGERWTEAGNHVGNGPFLLKEWSHDQRIVFEPNTYWHGEKPHLARIEINFIADDAAAFLAYRAGTLDSVIVPAASVREVSSPGSDLYNELVRKADLNTSAIFMNNAVAPFDNPKVRQAFELAVDREGYVLGVLQGAGHPTTSWLPPGMPGYDAELGKQWAYNPTKAKQLLAEAGYPNGNGMPRVTFVLIANDANRLVGQFLEDQLKKNLGADVEIEYVDSKTRSTRFTKNDYQAIVAGWTADWPYPDNWLPDQFGSDSVNNHAGYKSAGFDDLVKKAAAETDDKKRLGLYNDAHKQLLDDAVIVPLYNRESFILVKPYVKGLTITALDGGIKGDYFFHKTYIAAK